MYRMFGPMPPPSAPCSRAATLLPNGKDMCLSSGLVGVVAHVKRPVAPTTCNAPRQTAEPIAMTLPLGHIAVWTELAVSGSPEESTIVYTDICTDACRAGYYCTTDGLGRTYCCPDGLQNAECAKLYSLTISLMRETSRTALPTPSTGRPFSVTVLSTPTSKIHVTMTASTARRNATSTYKSAVKSASRNATSSFVLPTGKFNVTTSTTPPLFTGAAGKAAAGGMAILAGAAGLLF